METIEKIWPQWKGVELIGQGQFGHVYKVKREDFGNVFYSAVKIIHIPNETSSIQELKNSGMDQISIQKYFHSQVKELMNEIKVMESLKSAKTIVSIEDYEIREHKGRIGWTIYIRMELLESLAYYIGSHAIGRDEVIHLGMDICDALADCAQNQIIHRDIKFENIFRNSYGDFKLGDFGVAKQLEKTSRAATLAGTQTYMAPEILRMEKYDHRVDIYSLGLVLYRLLNQGRFPFVPENPMPDDIQNALEKRLRGTPLTAPCEADAMLADVIIRACSFRKEDRYADAKELKQELERCLYNQNGNRQNDQKKNSFAGNHLNLREEEKTFGWFGTESITEKSESSSENEPKRGEDILVDQYIDEKMAANGCKFNIEIDEKLYKAETPKNVKEGTELRLEGLGNPGEGGAPNGDLIICIHVLSK